MAPALPGLFCCLVLCCAANVFGKSPGVTDFIPYKGDGFKIDIPSKWNPSKEKGEFPGILLRYEDNFDAVCNLTVLAVPTSLSSAKDLSADDFLSKVSAGGGPAGWCFYACRKPARSCFPRSSSTQAVPGAFFLLRSKGRRARSADRPLMLVALVKSR